MKYLAVLILCLAILGCKGTTGPDLKSVQYEITGTAYSQPPPVQMRLEYINSNGDIVKKGSHPDWVSPPWGYSFEAASQTQLYVRAEAIRAGDTLSGKILVDGVTVVTGRGGTVGCSYRIP